MWAVLIYHDLIISILVDIQALKDIYELAVIHYVVLIIGHSFANFFLSEPFDFLDFLQVV